MPTGNIADFDTRWGLIERDTMPTYLELLHDDPDEVRRILTSDVRQRIDAEGIVQRTPEILRTATGVDVDGRLR